MVRCGTMEKDCMASHGASFILKDRMHDQSDPYQLWLCNICGLIAVHDKYTDKVYCRPCDASDVSLMKTPYSTKLLFQNLLGMNVGTRILTDEFEKKE